MTPTNERHCVNSVSVRFIKGPLPSTAGSFEEEALLSMKNLAQIRSPSATGNLGAGKSEK